MVAEYRRRLQVGRAIIIVAGFLFMGLAGVLGALNPLPAGEADFVGMTFAELQATNPRLADNIWHTNTGFSSVLVGTSLVVVLLAWRGLSVGSKLAWYSILVVGLSSLTGVLAAHIPIYLQYPSYNHWVLPFTLTVALLIGLGVAAKPVFSMKPAG